MKLWTLSLYYRLKPYLPRSLQLAMRRFRARIKLRTHGVTWPIDARAAVPPRNWKGWPDGKRFALILTHDIDTAKGQDRCRQLIRIEREMGFTASYNFVPERYKVDEQLRSDLTENGFEVGVHGLNHDGLYFSSERLFKERKVRINRYLNDWESVGFRTPSMLHNLDWLHGLDIKYDSSTFDTDPFEPQPDGVGTIFPFWVSSENGDSGYVEIPYTLPQDFLLFILLKQKSIDIWKKKLDWIAEKGGMALMLTHPDYIGVEGKSSGPEEYPAGLYAEILRYVREKYDGQYYHVLPRDIARYWKENHRAS